MRIRLGIGARLFLAFAAIAGLSSASALVGWLALRDVASSQAIVLTRAMPAAASAQAVAELSARLLAVGPLLNNARSEAERQQSIAQLNSEAGALTEALERLRSVAPDPATTRTLAETVEALIANSERQGVLVGQRLETEARFATASQTALDAAVTITDLSETLVSNAASGASAVIANLYDMIEAGEQGTAYDALDRLIEVDIYLMERMFELRLRSSQVALLVNQVGKTTETGELNALERAWEGHLRVLDRRVASIADPVRRQQAEAALETLQGASGYWAVDNLFTLRREQLAQQRQIAQLGEENRGLTADLSSGASDLVEEARAFSAAAAEEADRAVDTGLLLQILAAFAALALAGLIVWLYVQRGVARRLKHLAGNMRQLTDGDLAIEIDAGGSDELADMGRAMAFFRTEALRKRELEAERERTNAELRRHREELQLLVEERTEQLTEANRRLTDAVEQHAAARERAEAASNAKSDFLATMSHEIRTPMSGMLGMLRLVEGGPLEGRQRRSLQLASSAGQSLLAILNNILDYSKIESGHLELDETVFDARELVLGLASLMRPVAEEKGLTLTAWVSPRLAGPLIGDAGKLRQILFNLVGNAVKFTEQGGVEIVLDAAAPEQGRQALTLSVSDSGIGIPASGQEHVFEVFSQLDPSIARRYGGTGLGLAICRRLSELLCARLSLASDVGKGSRFTLSLSLALAGEQEGDAAAGALAEPAAMRPLSVLVVEDSPINREVAEAFLRDLGHCVALAVDGHQAVERAATGVFDLILMDISLPGMDGLEATRRIRALPEQERARVPIIATSAHVFRSEIDMHLAHDIDAFLAKPVFPETLARAIAAVISGSGERVFLPSEAQHKAGRAPLVLTQLLKDDGQALGWPKLQQLAELFAAGLTDDLETMRAAQQAADWPALARRLHRVKSAAAALGLVALAESLGEAEAGADGGPLAMARLQEIEETAALSLEALRRALSELAPVAAE